MFGLLEASARQRIVSSLPRTVLRSLDTVWEGGSYSNGPCGLPHVAGIQSVAPSPAMFCQEHGAVQLNVGSALPTCLGASLSHLNCQKLTSERLLRLVSFAVEQKHQRRTFHPRTDAALPGPGRASRNVMTVENHDFIPPSSVFFRIHTSQAGEQ